VAIDAAGNRLPVPPVIPETADEKRRYEDAVHRREIRRAEGERRKQSHS
jgi:acyl-CoA hydrolase